MTEKQAQAALEHWNGTRLEAERLKGDLRRLERLMDEKETPGLSNAQRRGPVSYTHLDVYKRQVLAHAGGAHAAKPHAGGGQVDDGIVKKATWLDLPIR